jgi:ribosomal RNA assembly protein
VTAARMPVLFVRIPEDRLGALIGPGGDTKRSIEEKTATRIDVDSEDEAVRVSSPDDGDPVGALMARDVVLAVGRGFSPARAMRLLDPDTYLEVLDIKEATGKREKAALRRIRARVIGSRGRARTRIEELSGCSVSVYGTTVALIGKEEQLERAGRAVRLLLRGSEHSTVFSLLTRMKREALYQEAAQPSETSVEGE